MRIYLNKSKEGTYLFSWKERIKIFFLGRLIFTEINLKKSLNAWMHALMGLNEQLSKDVQQIASDPLEDIQSKTKNDTH